MNNDRADVYKAGVRAATLRRFSHGVEFAYTEDYLAGNGPAVASTLPRVEQPRITQAGAVPPFFAGLLPEGRRLINLRRTIKASADDELSLLLAVGADPIGDVQIIAEGELPSDRSAVEVPRSFDAIRFADLLAEDNIIDPVGIAGVQDKVSARMLSLPVSRAHERYILKLNPPEYPHVVENENFFVALAKKAKLRVVSARVVYDADGRSGLLVTRFDRIDSKNGGGRLAVEDACQALNLWPADKYNVSLEGCALALIALCDARPVAARELFRQTVFAWLTGNGDLHAKNVSVLKTPEGEWQISPAYDLPSTVPYGDTTFALTIGGRRDGFSQRHLLDFAAAIGLPEPAAVRILDDLLRATSALIELADNAAFPFDAATRNKTVRQLRFRRHQLLPSGRGVR